MTNVTGYVYSVKQILAAADQRGRWGRWRLRPSNQTLYFSHDGPWYEIDLARCRTSAQALDWIVQFSHKAFVRDDPNSLTDLITALDDVLRLQSSLCSFGVASTLSVADLTAAVAAAAERWPEACLGPDDYPHDCTPLSASPSVGTPILSDEDGNVTFGQPLVEP